MTDMTDQYVKAGEQKEWTQAQWQQYYIDYASELAKRADDMVARASDMGIDHYIISCEFINTLLKLDNRTWGLFAKNSPDQTIEH